MSRVKKLLAVALAVVMAMALAVPTMAEEPTGTLRIAEARNGETYNVYKILSVNNAEGGEHYIYRVTDAFKPYFATMLRVNIGELTDNDVYSYINDQTNINDFAKDLAKWIQTNNVAETASVTAGNTSDKPENSKDTTVSIENLEYGYYLLVPVKALTDDGTGSVMFSLGTTQSVTTINSKTKYPVPVKKVKYYGVDRDVSTAAVGDTLEYTITANIPNMSSYTSYVFRFNDTMYDLTYVFNSLKVSVEGVEGQLTVDPTWDPNQKKLTIDLSTQLYNLFVQQAQAGKNLTGKEVKIAYEARVDESAATTHYAQNTVDITYSNDPNATTTHTSKQDKTRTYVINLTLNKIDKLTNSALTGSTWKLEKQDNGNNWIPITKFDTTLTNTSKSTFELLGLDIGRYRLTELSAPTGYYKLPSAIEFTINGNPNYLAETDTFSLQNFGMTITSPSELISNQTSEDDRSKFTLVIQAANKTHGLLPSTGGAGLYIIAGVAIVALLGFGGTAMLKRKVNGED